jgi:hypothetical protein
MRGLGVCLALVVVSCGKLSVDAEGKGCPCPEDRGLECDSVCDVCVPKGTPSGAKCEKKWGGCQVGFSSFRPAWVTPNSIYWIWDPASEDQASVFQSYRLEITPTLPAGEMRTYDASTNPELGVFIQPNDGADLTASALVTDLDPEVQYSGRLVVRDVRGCEYSEVAEAPQTHGKTSQNPIEIFGESGFVGTPYGGKVVSQGCETGSCFQMDACTPGSGRTKCCDNLRMSELSVQPGISSGQFQHAYLEFYAKNDSSADPYYAGVWLRIGPAEAGDNRYLLDGWTVPATGEYRRLQFPLRELANEETGTKLEARHFMANDVREFRWYTCLTQNASAWFDEVYIRW